MRGPSLVSIPVMRFPQAAANGLLKLGFGN
jgi:hypothetical protein